MPTTKSAEKRLRQNERRRNRNRSARSELRTLMRQVREASTAKNVELADKMFRQACKRLDQATARGILKKNTASRSKSRLSLAVKKAKGKA